MKDDRPEVIKQLFEKGIWSTRDNLFDKIRAGKKLREQEAPEVGKGASPDLISQIQGVLQKYGVKSARSFLGWDLSGGLADNRSFLSLGVKEEGFCLSSKNELKNQVAMEGEYDE